MKWTGRTRFRLMIGLVVAALLGGIAVVAASAQDSPPSSSPRTVSGVGADGQTITREIPANYDPNYDPMAPTSPDQVQVATGSGADAIGYAKKDDLIAARHALDRFSADPNSAIGVLLRNGLSDEQRAEYTPGVEVTDAQGNHLGWFTLSFTTERPANVMQDGKLTPDSPLARQ